MQHHGGALGVRRQAAGAADSGGDVGAVPPRELQRRVLLIAVRVLIDERAAGVGGALRCRQARHQQHERDDRAYRMVSTAVS